MTDLPEELIAIEELKYGNDRHPLGKGLHPAFHALWHLKALGVVTDLDKFEGEWGNLHGKPKVLVAVIDTPVAWHHPNLEGVIDLALMRDFSVHDAGVFAVPDVKGADEQKRKKLAKKIGKPVTDCEKMIIAEVAGEALRPLCTPRSFGAHGTAVAGLIGARPTTSKRLVPAFKVPPNVLAIQDADLPLPYAGVNPFCRIVPISTTASPDPKMVLAALEYAGLIDAKIVVIAAAWEDNDQYYKDETEWEEVNREVKKLCRNAIVLCAAGNSGNTALAYPALLSADVGGPIAVTACNIKNEVAAYAPDVAGERMIRCLSGMAESYSVDSLTYDPWKAVDPLVVHPSDDSVPKPGKITRLPSKSLISLDVPGPFGYNPSPYYFKPQAKGPHFDLGSLYCHFSGTSAATALAAGLISLVIQSGTQLKIPEGDKYNDEFFDLANAKNLMARSA